jgi:ElaB/YqjD/DUF883 family membrane-anchored ribosome-binding protein
MTEQKADELRRDLEEVRAELGETVEELAHRADVPARVRAKRDEMTQQARLQMTHAREVVAEKAPVVKQAARERPWLLACGALLVGMIIGKLRGRRNRKAGDGTR